MSLLAGRWASERRNAKRAAEVCRTAEDRPATVADAGGGFDRYFLTSTMPPITLALTVALLVSLCASRGAAQTLADVAKKEVDRRQGVKTSGRVITNKDLPTVPPPSAAPPAMPTTDIAPVTAADAKPAANGDNDQNKKPDAKAGPDKGGARDEKYWAGRMKSLQEELQRDRIFADSLQSRINALTMDFVNRDDPAQRDQIGRDRQTAVTELDRVKKSIVDRTKAIADLEEEARRAGVPPGWLR